MMPIINIHPLASESEAEAFRSTLKDADKFGLYCCTDGTRAMWSVIPKIALDLIFNAETALPVTERPWVGLTEDERDTILRSEESIFDLTEAKLKEKNA